MTITGEPRWWRLVCPTSTRPRVYVSQGLAAGCDIKPFSRILNFTGCTRKAVAVVCSPQSWLNWWIKWRYIKYFTFNSRSLKIFNPVFQSTNLQEKCSIPSTNPRYVKLTVGFVKAFTQLLQLLKHQSRSLMQRMGFGRLRGGMDGVCGKYSSQQQRKATLCFCWFAGTEGLWLLGWSI